MKWESADELHLRNSMAVVSLINISEFLVYDIDPKEKKVLLAVQSKTYFLFLLFDCLFVHF